MDVARIASKSDRAHIALIERIRAQYQAARSGIRVYPAVLVLLTGLTWTVVPHEVGLGWAFILGTFALLRWRDVEHFAKEENLEKTLATWIRRDVVATFLLGLGWGLLGLVLFYVDELHWVIVIVLVIGATCVTGAPMMVFHLPSYYAYAASTCSIVLFVLAYQQKLLEGGLAALFYLAVVAHGRRLGRSVEENFRLRADNDALLDDLRAKNREVEAAMQTRTQFLAAASHDLRQPVHALSFFIGALQERAGSEEDVRRIATLLESATHSVRSLLDGLLDISKLDAGTVKPQPEPIDLDRLLSEMRRELEPDAQSKGLELVLDSANAWVVSDRAMLMRILRNLVGNAIRYTDEGRVSIDHEDSSDAVRLMIRDTGCGIPEESLEEVFVEFRQIHNPERDRSQGLGLGLAIVRRLVNLLGHPLDVRSTVGEGTTFTLTLPRCATPDERKNTLTEKTIDAQLLVGRHILVIDDEPEVLSAMQQILRSWGCEAHLAKSGADAMALVNAGIRPDALIVDYRLRGNETGADAAKQVFGALGREVPSVIVTGDTSPDRIREAEASGLPLLHKPVEVLALRDRLVRMLGL